MPPGDQLGCTLLLLRTVAPGVASCGCDVPSWLANEVQQYVYVLLMPHTRDANRKLPSSSMRRAMALIREVSHLTTED